MADSGRVLADTSVWIDALRGRTPSVVAGLQALLRADRVMRCDVIGAELRAGLRSHERARFLEWFEAVPNVAVTSEHWQQAGDLAARLRARGATVPLTDLLVAVVCLGHELPLWTLDAHFDAIPELQRYPAARPSSRRSKHSPT